MIIDQYQLIFQINYNTITSQRYYQVSCRLPTPHSISSFQNHNLVLKTIKYRIEIACLKICFKLYTPWHQLISLPGGCRGQSHSFPYIIQPYERVKSITILKRSNYYQIKKQKNYSVSLQLLYAVIEKTAATGCVLLYKSIVLHYALAKYCAASWDSIFITAH